MKLSSMTDVEIQADRSVHLKYCRGRPFYLTHAEMHELMRLYIRVLTDEEWEELCAKANSWDEMRHLW